jgi:NTE family protein
MTNGSNTAKKRIGLALGGGGVRGLAHIGVFKVLESAGVRADLLAGTSMGGLLGAMYAAGMAVEQIEEEILERANMASLRRLIDFSLSYRGFLRGGRIYNLLTEVLGTDVTFADLQLPLAMVAVDARSGCEVVLKEGNVVDAVRATISVPGIFLPVEQDNMILVDGGILNNVPTDVARHMGADVVIAVDVMPDFSRNTPGETLVEPPIDPPSLPTFLQETLHIEYIMISALTRYRLQVSPADILLRPDLPAQVDLLIGVERAEEVIAAGEAAAQAALPAILALLEDVEA